MPVAVEVLGGLGTRTLAFLKELGHRLRQVTNDPRSTTFLRQRIAIATQMGNAACVLESMNHTT